MKTFRLLAATIAALSLATVTVAMPAGSKATAKPPKVNVQTPKGSTKAPKTSSGASKTGGASKSAKAAKATASKKSAPTSTASTSTVTTSESGTGTGTGTDTGSGTAPAEPNAISKKISSNPSQKARVEAMLPQGMTLEQATAGFRNQGQFLAALNASRNQGVNFADLQKAITVDGLSLGQAVKKLRNAPAPAPAPQQGTQW
jgi:hypothetical protein